MTIDLNLQNRTATVSGLKDLDDALDKVEGQAKKTETQGLSRFRRGLGAVNRRAMDVRSTLLRRLGPAFRGLGRLAVRGLAAATVAVGGLAWATINLASDALEASDTFRMTVPRDIRRGLRSARRYVDQFSGYTLAQIDQMSSMFVGQLGEALDPRQIGDLMRVGVDLESAFNLESGAGQETLQSLLAGEAEVGRKFGIDISQAAIDSSEYAEQLGKTMQEMTQAEKQQAIYNLVMESTQAIQDNAKDTAGSFANVTRQLGADIRDLGADVGEVLLPYATDLAVWAKAMVAEHGPALKAWVGDLAESVKRLAQRIEAWVERNGGLEEILPKVGAALKAVAAGFAAAAVAAGIFLLVTSPIALVVVAVAGLVAGIVYLYQTNETAASIMRQAWHTLKVAFATMALGIINAIGPLVAMWLTYLSTVLDGAAKLARLAGLDSFADKIDTARGSIDDARTSFDEFRESASARLKTTIDSSDAQIAAERLARMNRELREAGVDSLTVARVRAGRGPTQRAIGGTAHGRIIAGERGPEVIDVGTVSQVHRTDEVDRVVSDERVGRPIEVPLIVDGRELARASIDGYRALAARS